MISTDLSLRVCFTLRTVRLAPTIGFKSPVPSVSPADALAESPTRRRHRPRVPGTQLRHIEINPDNPSIDGSPQDGVLQRQPSHSQWLPSTRGNRGSEPPPELVAVTDRMEIWAGDWTRGPRIREPPWENIDLTCRQRDNSLDPPPKPRASPARAHLIQPYRRAHQQAGAIREMTRIEVTGPLSA
jgi:hypothetical protein